MKDDINGDVWKDMKEKISDDHREGLKKKL